MPRNIFNRSAVWDLPQPPPPSANSCARPCIRIELLLNSLTNPQGLQLNIYIRFCLETAVDRLSGTCGLGSFQTPELSDDASISFGERGQPLTPNAPGLINPLTFDFAGPWPVSPAHYNRTSKYIEGISQVIVHNPHALKIFPIFSPRGQGSMTPRQRSQTNATSLLTY